MNVATATHRGDVSASRHVLPVSMKIAIHPLTADPTAAWRELSQHQKVVKINTKLPTTEAPSDKLRVVCMSDTHSLTPFIKFDVPAGDVFIHAGDFTKCGSLQEVIEFNNWIGNLPHKHKIVIAGNHELSFDPTFTHPFSVHTSGDHQKHTGTSILDDIPTLGHGDLCCTGVRAGCVELLSTVQNRVKPKYHVFGHIHEGMMNINVMETSYLILNVSFLFIGYGISSDGKIIYINASTCDLNYLPSNPPIVFDITLPPGIKKS
ncbi:UPF0046 protein C25E10.12 isoform X5 [Cardiocondyla obscurior]|uniref:UPF0046 protein C25E10.12 isoform X5 n=1 Tax=Cardiocondyla obscurior TaxID=286306 RepID=UPI0039656635